MFEFTKVMLVAVSVFSSPDCNAPCIRRGFLSLMYPLTETSFMPFKGSISAALDNTCNFFYENSDRQ